MTNEKFSGCEIAGLAVQIEKNGRDFYFALLKKTDNPDAVKILRYLADEEEKHASTMKGVSESFCDYKPKGEYPEEYFAYMRALAAQYIFTEKEKNRVLVEKMKSFEQGIEFGIKMEKDSVLFYEKMKKIVPARGKEIINKIISEEKKHLDDLLELTKVKE
ncbi:MAG: ferritin family protein [Candidatus Omnitrophota bacterium]